MTLPTRETLAARAQEAWTAWKREPDNLALFHAYVDACYTLVEWSEATEIPAPTEAEMDAAFEAHGRIETGPERQPEPQQSRPIDADERDYPIFGADQ